MVISINVIFDKTSMIQVLAPKDSSIEIVQRDDKQVKFKTSLVSNSNEHSVPTA